MYMQYTAVHGRSLAAGHTVATGMRIGIQLLELCFQLTSQPIIKSAKLCCQSCERSQVHMLNMLQLTATPATPNW
jgi:hypothetical protein